MKIQVSDPFGAARDPALPTVALAIDPDEVQHELGRRLPRLVGAVGVGYVSVKAIRVTRHRPGSRCVLEYDVRVERPGMPVEKTTLIGKVRVGSFGLSGHRRLSAFWRAGFDGRSADGISVPKPIGTVARFRMFLQRKVSGPLAAEVLAGDDGMSVARRIADAARKIHDAGVPTAARHSMADEVRILRDCLARVGRAQPRLAPRLDALSVRCERLAAATPAGRPTGIHRDFYPDQVIVHGERLFIIDLDTYCEGDPALDVGNFIGHMTEQSVRLLGRADALAHREEVLAERFAELAGDHVRAGVTTYALLTLVRHVYLSTMFPERRPFTGTLLDLCEERLATAERSRSLRCA